MKKKYRNIGLIVIGLILMAAIIINLTTPLAVPALVIESASYRESIKEEGTLYAPIRWDLYAPEILLVKAVHIKEGDFVEHNQLLAELDDGLISKQLDANQNAIDMQITGLKAELSMAASQKNQYSPELRDKALQSLTTQISSQRLAVEGARKDYENSQALYAEGFIAQSELDSTRQSLSQMEAGLAERQAIYDSTRAEMEAMWNHYGVVEEGLQNQITMMESLLLLGETDYQSAQLAYIAGQTKMTAPFSGRILSVNIREGQIADALQPAISIYDENEVALEVYLLAADASIILPGMEAMVTLDDKEETIIFGTVMTVSAQATEQLSILGILENRVKVEIALATEAPLIIGQKADVELIIKTEENGIGIPKSCVFPYEDGYAVMTIAGKKARLVPIEKDFETDTMVIVKTGLEEGDTVILTPSVEGLKAGKTVKRR